MGDTDQITLIPKPEIRNEFGKNPEELAMYSCDLRVTLKVTFTYAFRVQVLQALHEFNVGKGK